MNILLFSVLLFIAYVLDMLLGDPLYLPHPVRWIGRAIAFLETLLRGGAGDSVDNVDDSSAETARLKLLGLLLALVIVGGVYGVSQGLLLFFYRVSPSLYYLLFIYIIFVSLSVRSLKVEAEAVLSAMEGGDLGLARERLSRIVGRDTAELSEAEVYKAAAETVAENTSDGVVAPLFYLALGGPALMLAYKAVNTLDSMVGYRNDRYRYFGWFSARLDDVANFIPARLTALLMIAASYTLGYDWKRALKTVLRDGGNHSSPNSGVPEAAVAGAAGVKFGGPASYGGVVVVKPFIGCGGAEPRCNTVTAALRILSLTAFLAVLFTIILRLLIIAVF